MNRRYFITGAVALITCMPTLLLADNTTIEYTPGIIKEKLAAGETVFVDYAATWCSTCKRQERVIDTLRAENPEIDKNVTFIKVDWDTYSSHAVSVSRNIPRRSTLILLKGEDELGRIVAGTSSDEIKALIQLGMEKT